MKSKTKQQEWKAIFEPLRIDIPDPRPMKIYSKETSKSLAQKLTDMAVRVLEDWRGDER